MTSSAANLTDDLDIFIVGAGFAGIQALYHAQQRGLRAHLVEAGSGLGGTWFWNRYPGARVDVESLEYSMEISEEIQQEWEWSERYASQPEVRRYLEWATDRLGIRSAMTFGRTVAVARFDPETNRWTMEIRTTDDPDAPASTVRATYLVLATGFLSVPNYPAIVGLHDFGGVLAHTGFWPDEGVEVAGKRVGVIGTAASGVQVVQTIASQVGELFVFQRTPNWAFPLRNEPMDPEYQRWVKENYAEIRRLERENRGPGMVLMGKEIVLPESRNALEVSQEERIADYERRWAAGGVHMGRSFPDLIRSREANETLRVWLEQKIREIVDDPETARLLTPTFPPLTRRPPGEQGYYEAFNRDNVHLVDIASNPVGQVTADGVLLADGTRIELDVLVCATGFDAGRAALGVEIVGPDGTLQDAWADGVRTYLGMMVSGFPNLFLLNGPQSPAPHFSPPLLAAFQAEFVCDLAEHQRSTGGGSRIEATPEAEEAWIELVNSIYAGTLIVETNSWWIGTNIPGKRRQAIAFAGGFAAYRERVAAAIDAGEVQFGERAAV